MTGPTTPSTGRRWLATAAAVLVAAALGFMVGRGSAPTDAALAKPGAGGTGATAAGPGAGGTGTTAAADAAPPPGFVRAAAVAHRVYVPEVRHPVEVSGDERGHLWSPGCRSGWARPWSRPTWCPKASSWSAAACCRANAVRARS